MLVLWLIRFAQRFLDRSRVMLVKGLRNVFFIVLKLLLFAFESQCVRATSRLLLWARSQIRELNPLVWVEGLLGVRQVVRLALSVVSILNICESHLFAEGLGSSWVRLTVRGKSLQSFQDVNIWSLTIYNLAVIHILHRLENPAFLLRNLSLWNVLIQVLFLKFKTRDNRCLSELVWGT